MLYFQGLLVDFARHSGGFRQGDFLRLDLAVEGATNTHRFGLDRAFDHGLAGQRQGSARDVAVNYPFDVNIAAADEVSGDL